MRRGLVTSWALVSWSRNSFSKSLGSRRHARGSGHPEVFEIPGFRLALAIASLAGMTFELLNELKKHHTRFPSWIATLPIHGVPTRCATMGGNLTSPSSFES